MDINSMRHLFVFKKKDEMLAHTSLVVVYHFDLYHWFTIFDEYRIGIILFLSHKKRKSLALLTSRNHHYASSINLKLQKVLQDTVVYSSGGGIVYDNSCNTF
jgi:hypothetical protein